MQWRPGYRNAPWYWQRRNQNPFAPGSGTRDEQIRWVQHFLNRILNQNLPVDGVMSPATRTAVRNFQQRYGLPATGYVGPDTQQALVATTSSDSGMQIDPGVDMTGAAPANQGVDASDAAGGMVVGAPPQNPPGADADARELLEEYGLPSGEFGLQSEFENWESGLNSAGSRGRGNCHCHQPQADSGAYEFEGYNLDRESFELERNSPTNIWEREASPANAIFRYVRDFSGNTAECNAALRRAGKTKAEALAIINVQIRLAIAMLRSASTSLKQGSRTTTTRNMFQKIFRVKPEVVPNWLKQTATIKDRGDVVATRCRRVADLLASGTIKYFCTINSTNCPDCGNDSSGSGCSSWGDESVAPQNSQVVCLGDAFWDDMRAGNTTGVLATLMHEPFHIFYGKYVTEHVMNRGKFGGIDCIVQFVFERNSRVAPVLESDGCAGRAVREELGEFFL